MARICEITGRKTITGNNKSHANNKTRRKFMVNLQRKSFYVQALDTTIPLSLSTQAMRTINKNGLLPTLYKAKKEGTLAKHLILLLELLSSLQPQSHEQEK